MKKALFSLLFLLFSGIACVIPDSKPIETLIPNSTPTYIITPIQTDTPVTLTRKAMTNVEIGLHIRDSATEHGLDLGVIPPETEVSVTGNLLENGWILVEWNGISGYVNSRYIIFK